MMRWSRISRGALAAGAVASMLAVPASTVPASAQAGWPFELEWDQPGQPANYFQLCANDACSVLTNARNPRGTTWRAPLPMLPPGEYRLVVQACGVDECLSGTPDLVIRVLPPSSRRPPIDVLDGPRIPMSR